MAREGNAAPGFDDGTVFSSFTTQSDLFNGINATVINAQGRVAFGGPSSSGFGIWAQDDAGELKLIAHVGQKLEEGAEESPTITELNFVGGAGDDDGRSSGFNNLGQVAFYASLSDGSTGIFVSNLVATLPDLPGAYNNNGTVDAADYTVWLDNLGAITNLPGDTTPGSVTQADYDVWKANFGAILSVATTAPVPEPSSLLIALLAISAIVTQSRQHRKSR